MRGSGLIIGLGLFLGLFLGGMNVYAQSQTVRQSGAVTASHASCWTTTGIIQDCGTSTGPNSLTTLGITANGGQPFCVQDTTNHVGPYRQFCIGVSSSGVGTVYLNPYGGASPTNLNFNINGVTYPFPGGYGDVSGPVSAIIGDVACWNSSAGTLLKDCGYVPTTPTGVICNGSTDITTPLQAAVTAAESAGGGVISLPVGTCVTSGPISITSSGIHIVGQGPTATLMQPSGGSFNIFSFTGTATTQDGGVENLSFNMTNMSGGNAISVNGYNRTTFRDISSFNTINFLYDQSTNAMAVDNVNVFEISGSYCFELEAPGSARSDVEDFTNVTCGGKSGSTYIGIIMNGFVNTVNLHSFAVSKPNGGGILAENTVSGSQGPEFFFGHDFQVEGATNADGIHLTSMNDFYCADCYSSSNGNDGIYAAAATSDINIVNSMMELNGKYAVETYAYDGGTGTTGTSIIGGNLSGNSQGGSYSEILIGATALNVIVSGVNLSGEQAAYGVTVQSGARWVTLADNNYTGAASGSVDDLSNAAAIIGGIGANGIAYGPNINDAGLNGIKQLQFSNFGTSGSTISQLSVITGTPDASGFISQTDGPTPVFVIGNGPADTGGIDITAAAGNIALAAPTGKLIIAGKPIQLPGYTVSTLPSCGSGQAGAMAWVSDATTPTYNGALTGGSNVGVPVFCNGSAWTSH